MRNEHFRVAPRLLNIILNKRRDTPMKPFDLVLYGEGVLPVLGFCNVCVCRSLLDSFAP